MYVYMNSNTYTTFVPWVQWTSPVTCIYVCALYKCMYIHICKCKYTHTYI